MMPDLRLATGFVGPRRRGKAGKETCPKLRVCRPFVDGETRTRTGDTTIFSRVLYQLSYLAVVEGQRSASARDRFQPARRAVR